MARRRKWRLGGIIAAGLVWAGSTLAASPAHADVPAAGAPVCQDGSRSAAAQVGDATNVIDIRDVDTGVPYGQSHVKLRWSPAANCVWPWIGGPDGSTVWVDREHPAPQGPTIEYRLAPRDVRSNNGSTYGPARPLGGGVRVRACGSIRPPLPPACTSWFDGSPDVAPAPRPGGYVALGDSFSAGQGAGDFIPGTDTDANQCHRSANAYPVLLGRAIGEPPTFGACSGATTRHFTTAQKGDEGQDPQQWQLSSGPALVTFTMGGNDGSPGFSDVAEQCAGGKVMNGSSSGQNCLDVLLEADAVRNLQAIHDGVAGMLRGIQAANHSPNLRILVVGYPKVFPDAPQHQCRSGVGPVSFLIREMLRINELTDHYNAAARAAAREGGPAVSFVDETRVLQAHDKEPAHDACADDANRWINLAYWPAPDRVEKQSFHPNAAGQAAMVGPVLACRNDPSVCRPS